MHNNMYATFSRNILYQEQAGKNLTIYVVVSCENDREQWHTGTRIAVCWVLRYIILVNNVHWEQEISEWKNKRQKTCWRNRSSVASTEFTCFAVVAVRPGRLYTASALVTMNVLMAKLHKPSSISTKFNCRSSGNPVLSGSFSTFYYYSFPNRTSLGHRWYGFFQAVNSGSQRTASKHWRTVKGQTLTSKNHWQVSMLLYPPPDSRRCAPFMLACQC